MKIGDEVYIHGYVDEIRSDVVIIRNEGGYFGTVPSEVNCSEKPNNCEDEPRTDYRITDTIGYKCPKCGRGNFLNNESNCVYCGEPLIKTDCAWGKGEE